jgi:hypothetical protein
MNENMFVKDEVEEDPNPVQSAWSELHAAQNLLKRDRALGLAALNDLFRSGKSPGPPLNGRYVGQLIALDVAPVLTQFFQWLTNAWMPWLGKSFNMAQGSGDNIFARDSYSLARFFNPFYRGFVSDTNHSYRGFAFRTYVSAGLFDAHCSVLKIDYNLKHNPSITVRRVLDELVQLDDPLYLGKAHVRWWWRPADGWQTVAYFTLSKSL